MPLLVVVLGDLGVRLDREEELVVAFLIGPLQVFYVDVIGVGQVLVVVEFHEAA